MKISQLNYYVGRAAAWYEYKLPGVLVWFALLVMVVNSVAKFADGTLTAFLSYYLTAAGLAVALTSVTFGYARVLERDEMARLTGIGELFLHSVLYTLVALILCWTAATLMPHPFVHANVYNWKSWVASIFLAVGQISLFNAANHFHTGIVDLQSHLLPKTFGKDDVAKMLFF